MNSTPLRGGLRRLAPSVQTPTTRAVVHDCDICAATGDTPLVLAFRLLGVAPDNQYHYRYDVQMPAKERIFNEETWYDRGYAAGLNGEAVGTPVNKTPFELDTDDEQKVAWLVGYVAGSMAALNDWQSDTCKLGDRAFHLTNNLTYYMREVERVGKLPVGCLNQSPFCKGMMQTFMDNEMPQREAADAVLVLVANGVIKDLPTPSPKTKFDPNPTVRTINGVGQYGSYIASLDRSDPYWFWADLDHMAPEMKKVAIKRRLAAVGEGRALAGDN